MTVVVISYWNPCFWLVISRLVTDICHLSLKRGFVKRVPGISSWDGRKTSEREGIWCIALSASMETNAYNRWDALHRMYSTLTVAAVQVHGSMKGSIGSRLSGYLQLYHYIEVQAPVSQSLFSMTNDKNQWQICWQPIRSKDFSVAYNKNCHLSLMTSFVKRPTGECFTKAKIDFKLDLTMAGRLCPWLLSPLVSQLWYLDYIFSYNDELSKNVYSVDLWPWLKRLFRNQCQEWLEELLAWMACHS